VSTTHPTVTFVIPCYKLGHLLHQCVESILAQDFEDFEVLIMDDCSPDDTPSVARSFRDPRVLHVRNDPNLGHMRNYNKGVELARGRYVWLISADDYLRRPYVLRRYVEVMERNPRIGYAFCSGVGVRDGEETGLIESSRCGKGDWVMPGTEWLRRLLHVNNVLAASVMARRACYMTLGNYPLDMPWANDWYMWCLFAFDYDVAYFDEPMVCYRQHGLSMTSQLTLSKAAACCEEEIRICWSFKHRADAAGRRELSREALQAVSEIYAKNAASVRFGRSSPILTVEQVEESLCHYTGVEAERQLVRARVFALMGSAHYWQGDLPAAAACYDAALSIDPFQPSVIAKRAMVSFGDAGTLFRVRLRSLSLALSGRR
jgi:glycosyltransferase involved in cell wall biosynthesis